HHRISGDSRQRNDRRSARPREPHRDLGRGHEHGRDVRLHRVRDRSGDGPQSDADQHAAPIRRCAERRMSETALTDAPRRAPGPMAAARRLLGSNPAAARLVVVLLAVALWELAGHTVLDPSFISPPSAILRAMPRVLGEAGVRNALWASLFELVVAFVIAVVA